MVYINYDPTGRRFEVRFQEHQGRTVKWEFHDDVTAAETWTEILRWLGVP